MLCYWERSLGGRLVIQSAGFGGLKPKRFYGKFRFFRLYLRALGGNRASAAKLSIAVKLQVHTLFSHITLFSCSNVWWTASWKEVKSYIQIKMVRRNMHHPHHDLHRPSHSGWCRSSTQVWYADAFWDRNGKIQQGMQHLSHFRFSQILLDIQNWTASITIYLTKK